MSPDPLKPGPYNRPYVNHYIMQSTGHETQTWKTGSHPFDHVTEGIFCLPSDFPCKNNLLHFLELILLPTTGAKAHSTRISNAALKGRSSTLNPTRP